MFEVSISQIKDAYRERKEEFKKVDEELVVALESYNRDEIQSAMNKLLEIYNKPVGVHHG
jgi:predicted Zn-dependent protease with MMP-like domain